MRFCNNCGNEVPGNTSFCKNCGSQIKPTQPSREQQVSNSNKSSKLSTAPSVKPKKKFATYILVAVVLILTAGGIGGYYFVKAESSPRTFVESISKALENKDVETLQTMIKVKNTSRVLSASEWERVVNDLHKDEKVLEKVLSNLEKQKKALEDPGTFKEAPFIFELKKMQEKKWGLISQYSLSILPVSFQVEIDKDAEVYVNKVLLNPTGENIRTIENYSPGSFLLKAIKKGEFDTFELEESYTIWESPESPITLGFQESYITVNTSQPGTDLYVNGKIYGKFVDEDWKIGPLNKDQTLTIQGKYTYPSGEVYTDKVVASGDETVSLNIPPEPVEEIEKEEPEVITVFVDAPFNENAVKVSVMDAVFGYNTSYIHAISNLDTSLLRNAKGAQLKEATDIVVDLKRRSVYYIGHLTEMKFDAESFSIENAGGTYKANVSVEETYMSGWKNTAATSSPALKQKKYYYTYTCEYDTSSGTWIVTGNKEHKGLTIKDPVYY